MPYLHHLDKSKNSVKGHTKIKLERDLGPEILTALTNRELSKLSLIWMAKATNTVETRQD